jgi:hypothetical protein
VGLPRLEPEVPVPKLSGDPKPSIRVVYYTDFKKQLILVENNCTKNIILPENF